MQVDAPVGSLGRGREGGGGGENDGFFKRGTKRGASDSNLSDNERFDLDRFEKRLRLLSLRNHDQNGTDKSPLYTAIPPILTTTNGLANHAHSQPPMGGMQVDDNPNRVYIHDLDAELADEPPDEEERLIFLPDIEKHFSKLPRQVLSHGDADADDNHRELVLYDVPRSLTVDEGHDSVRKAIIEARQRAREKVMDESKLHDLQRVASHSDATQHPAETAHWYNGGFGGDLDGDPDAMDMG